jgi:alpha-L-rhamnosidase
MKSYWGGMVRADADTFWEAYSPEQPRASPYGDVRNNSFCHAWSCTPRYLLRVKLTNFLNAEVAETVCMEELDGRYINKTCGKR